MVCKCSLHSVLSMGIFYWTISHYSLYCISLY